MHSSTYANLDALEGNCSGAKTVVFARRPRRIVITNDSISDDLQFKLNASENFASLKPTETITMDATAPSVFLQTAAPVDYRIWGIG
jgi:hypothetical protein